MKFILFISSLGLLAVLSACTHENNPNSLNYRYEKCMKDPECSNEERFQIANEMGDYLRNELRRMNKNCLYKNYEDCLSLQSNDLEQWHKTNSDMLMIMKSME